MSIDPGCVRSVYMELDVQGRTHLPVIRDSRIAMLEIGKHYDPVIMAKAISGLTLGE
jgi:hypothetical protein